MPAAPRGSGSGAVAGVDVGGTFTDLVARGRGGHLLACEVPTTASSDDGVLAGLDRLTAAPLDPVAHGTSVARARPCSTRPSCRSR